ncbi:MAG: caspase family protein [Deltaproteobacteria bacterium]|nr:caspase family protein [Deltaproteobacteria bacterium]
MKLRPQTSPALTLAALLGGALLLLSCGHAGVREKGGKGAVVHLAGLSPEVVDRQLAPRKVALLVGIDTYSDPFWTPLRYAAKDARDLGAVLSDPARGGFDEVRVLTGPEETSRAALLEAVRSLAALAPRPTDTVVVYLSGHGTLAPSPTGALDRVLVTTTTDPQDLRGTGLLVDDLLAAYEGLPSRRKALILATCHSGGGKSLLTPQMEATLARLKGPSALETVSRASLVLSAADLGQPAREDDGLQHDVYTHFLIEALTAGADANGDGAVSATEAHDHARRQTYDYTQGKQIPSVESTIIGADPVLLAGHLTGPGLPVVYSYAPGLSGYSLKVNGRTKGTLPGQVVLGEGAHALELTREGQPTLDLGRVRLGPGDRLAADQLLLAREPGWRTGLGAGATALTGRDLARETLRPVPRLGLFLERRRFLSPSLALRLDLAVGYTEQTAFPAGVEQRQTVRFLTAGGALLWSLERGPLRLQLGPHLNLASLSRTFYLSDLVERQSLTTLLPGGHAGVVLRLRGWEVGLEGQLHYLPFVLDGEVHSTSMGVAALTLGRSF